MTKLLDRILKLEQELRRYRDCKDELEVKKAIDEVMEKHRIRSYGRAETLDEALSRGYPKSWTTCSGNYKKQQPALRN